MSEEPVRDWRFKARIAAWALLGLAALSVPLWAPGFLSHMSFFRMQKVEVRGVNYLAEGELLRLLRVDTTWSIWTDLGVLEDTVATHPLVKSVKITRRLPGTIVVHVEEHRPVAMVPRSGGLSVVDEGGTTMPVDPSRSDVDVPIVHSADTALVRLLAELREAQPALYARVSEVRRVGRDELRIDLLSYPVRANTDVTVDRLSDILRVERDLATRGVKVAELDLRFRGQVIARLQ